MDHPDYETRYRCHTCGTWFVVPTLARACEDKHHGDSREDDTR